MGSERRASMAGAKKEPVNRIRAFMGIYSTHMEIKVCNPLNTKNPGIINIICMQKFGCDFDSLRQAKNTSYSRHNIRVTTIDPQKGKQKGGR